MTANEAVERIKKNLGVPWNDRTYRDTFKAGNPETEVKGIATTFMATLNQLQRSHAAGMNFVVTHEPTFWSDTDAVKDLADDPIYQFKVDFCKKNDMVVWRLHDHLHARKPDLIWVGLARALGWQDRESSPDRRRYTIPPTTLGGLAADVKRHLNVRNLRVVARSCCQSEHHRAWRGLQHSAHFAGRGCRHGRRESRGQRRAGRYRICSGRGGARQE